MREAMNTLKEYTANGKKFLVVGNMMELGDETSAAHKQLGNEVAQQAFDFFVAVGDLARLAGEAAEASGMNKEKVQCFDSHQEAIDFLKSNSQPGDCLLFKGSREACMEKVLEGLTRQD